MEELLRITKRDLPFFELHPGGGTASQSIRNQFRESPESLFHKDA